MRNTNDWKEKFQAFCESLEMENIPKLMAGSVGDFRLIGKVMAQRIKDVKSGMANAEARCTVCGREWIL